MDNADGEDNCIYLKNNIYRGNLLLFTKNCSINISSIYFLEFC